jgi:hypothetical protein
MMMKGKKRGNSGLAHDTALLMRLLDFIAAEH